MSFCFFLLELWIEFEFELGGESICIYVLLGLNSGFVDLFTWALSVERVVEEKMRWAESERRERGGGGEGRSGLISTPSTQLLRSGDQR